MSRPITIPRRRLTAMAAAGREVRECMRVLFKTGHNILSEVLRGTGSPELFTHYPQGDVYDADSHAQYYYHCHRDGEHGHFHTFLRPYGMPPGIAATSDNEALAHLVAISLDDYARPSRLFTTNRWVTGEHWYPASQVCQMLGCFRIDQAWPSWAVNRWLSAMVGLFHPQIEELLRQRDRRLAEWQAAHEDCEALEDRELDVLSSIEIDIDAQIDAIETALAMG